MSDDTELAPLEVVSDLLDEAHSDVLVLATALDELRNAVEKVLNGPKWVNREVLREAYNRSTARISSLGEDTDNE